MATGRLAQDFQQRATLFEALCAEIVAKQRDFVAHLRDEAKSAAASSRPSARAAVASAAAPAAASAPSTGSVIPAPDDEDDFEDDGVERAALVRRTAVENEVEFNSAVIEQTERDVQGIARSVVEVGQLFNDLAAIIKDQGLKMGAPRWPARLVTAA